MAASSIAHLWKYDVFVSFRGEDIRKSFMDHLFNDFKQKGIYAFRDDNELPKGEEISPHLYQAIEESRFLIVIFSKHYAFSSWCLRELVKVLECKQTENPKYEVQIIFYDIKPDVVRKQKGSYAEAFRNHEVSNSTEVGTWKKALSMAADLSGYDLQDMTNGYESKLIDCITKDILRKLCDGPLHVGENLVGIDFHLDKLKLSRFVASHKVNMVGICGISGIGKTTLAKAIYNLMYIHFEESCFCDDVQGVEKRQGLTQVQMQMISKILKREDLRISSVGEGTMKIIFLDIACSLIGENKYYAASVLDSSNCSANANIEVLVDKFLITVSSSNMSLQMHELIQSMAREITREEFNMPGNRSRLWISSEVHDPLNKNKVTEEVEVLVLLLKNNGQNILLDGKAFAHMKNLRILKIYIPQFKKLLQPFGELKLTGSLDFLSNELRLFCWHGYPFKYLPSDFYPENIVAIDLSYSRIKHLWSTPKSFRRLKVMKLRYCCNLTSTPDFSHTTNLSELNLEGCVNLISIHSSIGMLKRLILLNLRDCKQLRIFPSRVEMDSLQVLNLSGCFKVNQLPEDLSRIKSLTELHVDRTAIIELPSFVSSLINLESLSFGGQERIRPRWWTSITVPFGLTSEQLQHPQRSVLPSFTRLRMLKYLNFSYCNLLEVPESIGGLSCLKKLNLQGNNFTSLPGSLRQLSHLERLFVDGCKKLEVLPEIPPSVWNINASYCTSLREVLGSSRDIKNMVIEFINCPNLFKNDNIDREGSISKTQSLDSSITSQGFIHQLSALLQTNRCEFLLQDNVCSDLDMVYHGNSMPEWFTNRSRGNHVKVELPSDWCYDKFLGYGTCVVFKCRKPLSTFEGYSVNNVDGASLITIDYFPDDFKEFLKKVSMDTGGTHNSDIIWLHYTRYTWTWEEANSFVTFSFGENNEDIEVKEFGVRLIFDEDIQQDVISLKMVGP